MLHTHTYLWNLKFEKQIGTNRRIFFTFIKDAGNEDPQYGLVDNGGDYGAVIGCSNGDPHIFALRLRPRQPNFHSGAGSDLTTYTLLE